MKDTRALEIASKLAQSKKYRHLCDDTLNRISQWAVTRHSSVKEAEKAAKRKLHQIYAAYITTQETKKIEALVRSFQPAAGSPTLQEFCLRILECHASSRERIHYLPTFYGDIKNLTGEPGSVLDLSCGLNPFTLPWLALPPGASYHCIDIDCRLIGLINEFMSQLPGNNSAACEDILVSPPTAEVDVVLLLKSLPCLEQQEPDAGLRLLNSLKARYVVVSFPVRSLGGHEKGMSRHYDDFMGKLTERLGVEVSTLSYPDESVYVMKK
jgi:16S rRNA (guanine(1405)-N(7))-methyltransferase